MHGLGNDFVIIDGRDQEFTLDETLIKRLGDRHFGIGFDQLALMREDVRAHVRIDFWNSDGGGANACGNATRCVADLIMNETGENAITLQTGRGELAARRGADGKIAVNMGQPQFNWQEIPLSEAVDIDALPIDGAPSAIGMGNPHLVFFVEDAEAVDIERLGAQYERHPLFPKRANVEFVSLIGKDRLRMRVWERGGMVTLACGSGACAAGVAAARRSITGRDIHIEADGGELGISWKEDGVWLEGPVSYVAEGELDARFLDEAR